MSLHESSASFETTGSHDVAAPFRGVTESMIQSSEVKQLERIFSNSVPPLQEVHEFPPAFRATVDRVRSQYAHLYDLPVIEHADGSRSFHNARLIRHHGINLLFVKGDFVEMSFQHGRLLSDEIPYGAPPQSAKMVENAVANALGAGDRINKFVARLIHRWFTRTIVASAIDSTRRALGHVPALQEAVSMSDATRVPVSVLVRALFNPETMMLLARMGNNSYGQTVNPLAGFAAPVSCCSTFAAWGEATEKNDLLIGRNMDYPLNGFYDRFPTVIYFEPTGRDALKYMTFTSAGIHTAGLNAYNEAGIFLTSHIVPTTEMSSRGVPVFMTANQVIRRAKNFDMAIEIFKDFRPPSGWAYLLASTKENRIATVEISNQDIVVRETEKQNCHIQTNHYLTPEMRDRHLFLNSSVTEDNDGRYLRIQQRLQQAYSRLNVGEAISILGDQVDPYVGEVRGLGNTVGVHTTMTSLVLDPAHDRVFVATGEGPVSHNDYVEIPLSGTCQLSKFTSRTWDVVRNSQFKKEHPEKYAALKMFIRAKRSYEIDNDVRRSYELLKEVVERDDSNPAYFFQLGIFALKNDQFEDARQAFESMFERPYLTDQLRRLGWYYRGRVNAHLGNTDVAINDFKRVVSDDKTDKKLHAASQRAMRRVKTFGRCRLAKRSLSIMMQQSDMLRY